MSEKKKRKRFNVQVKIDLFMDHELLAESLEDALAQAKELRADDVLDIQMSLMNDAEIKVVGVYGP